MIKLTSIELRNFGRHRHIHQPLSGNVIGLTGPNGRGKSTVLQAIQFALTGNVDHPDPLPKFIRQSSGADRPKNASVILHFDVGGKKGRVERKITPTTNSREVTFEGCVDENGKQKVLTSDKAVAALMFDILGVDKRALNSTVFIKQGAIADMFGKDTNRREFYTRLLMLGHVEKHGDTVEIYRKQVASSVKDLGAVKDAAEAALAAATEQFNEADELFRASGDCTGYIAIALQISSLLADQMLASDSIGRELATLEGSDERLIAIEKEKDTNTQQLKKLNDLRAAAAAASQSSVSAERELNVSLSAKELYAERRRLNLDLSAQQDAASGGDQTAAIDALKQHLAVLQRMKTLPGEVQDQQFQVALAQGNLDAETDRLNAAVANDSAVTRELVEKEQDLRLRKQLQQELAGSACDDASCVLCGSASPNTTFLDSTIAKLTPEVEALRTQSAETTKLRMGLAASYNELSRTLASATTTLQAKEKELAGHVEFLATRQETEEGITAELARLVEIHGHWAAADMEIRRLNIAIANIEARIRSQVTLPEEDLETVVASRQETHARLMAEAAALNEELRTCPIDAAALDARLKVLLDEGHKLRDARVALESARAWLKRTEDDLYTATIAAQNFPPEAYRAGSVFTPELASAVSSKLQAMQSEYDRRKGLLEASRESMTREQGNLINLEVKIAEQQQRLALADRLTRLRDAFRPTGIVTKYLDYKFSHVATVAADYLAESHADFTTIPSTSEPLAFDFMRLTPGETWLSQSRLSGGQRVRLAVATLRAIHSIVMPNVGLMVLDEPTTHLDTEAKTSMAEMLRRIGSEGGLQMIVCDHDPILIDAFSSTIDIPE